MPDIATMRKTSSNLLLHKLLWALISQIRSIWTCLQVRVTKQMKHTFMVMHIGLLHDQQLCITGYILQLQHVICMHVSLNQLSYHACHGTSPSFASRRIAKTSSCCTHCWALHAMQAARPAQCRLHTHPAKPNTAPASTTSAGGTHKASTSANPTIPAVCHFSFIVIRKQVDVFLCLYVLHVQDGLRWPCHQCNSTMSSKGSQCCLDELFAMHSSRVTYQCSQLLREMGCLHGLSAQAETQLQQSSQWQQR